MNHVTMKPKRTANLMNILLKSCIVFMIMASASLVDAQTLQALYPFNNVNGANPYAGLALGNDGNFYGTTYYGGITNSTWTQGMGTVFKVTTNGTLTTLFSFTNNNELSPSASLILGDDGNFYGTTSGGWGTVFNVTTSGTLTMLFSFGQGGGTLGSGQISSLTLGSDGNFYGTANAGGYNHSGTVFQVATNGTVSMLVSFSGANGANPIAALTLGNYGNLYGTTVVGGNTNLNNGNGFGTVFQVTTNGTLTTLFSFSGMNGANPTAALTLGNDGIFYGTTEWGGSGNAGTVFQVTTNGTLTTLVSFSGANGANPTAALTLGNDGIFYGTTLAGGSGNAGTVFQMTTNGTLTTLVSFSGANGASPQAALTLGNDGIFYGTTSYGGITNSIYRYGFGTVFRLLLIPVITSQPQSQTNNAGTQVSFSVSTATPSLMAYQWQKNGTNVVNAGNISGANTSALTITSISDNDVGNYSVIVTYENNSVTSSNALLTVVYPPIITAQPTNQIVLPGTNVAFGISLTGSAPFFRYQWRFNGTNLLNATNALYTISGVATNKAGNYSVVVTNAAGIAVSSNAALTVVLSPASRTNYAGSTTTFTAIAFTPEALRFQWQKGGSNLFDGGNTSGSTNSALTIATISDADAAIYNLVVSDASSSVTTSNATLTVNDSLFIATQPLSQAVAVGNNVTFTAKAYGAPPFIFQWYYSNAPAGSPTSGTNVSSFTLTNVHINQSGNYKVQVINGLGSLMSSNAVLTVFVRPTLNLQLLANYPMLNLNGMLSNNFVVQYNTNLAGTNWITLLSLTNLLTSPYQFLDPAGVVPPARFYRVLMQ
jgi:uncharacterized repeat protein (TIGR03803 family)